MKNTSIFLTIVLNTFLHNFLFSQTLYDTIFKNVIKIDKENTAQIGNSYLIDIPIQQNRNFLILLNNYQIPNKLFFGNYTFSNNLKEFILISPDYEYYREVAEFASSMGGCAEPVPSNKFYHFKRERNNIIIDSVTIRGNQQPLIIFESQQKINNNDSILSYFTEYIRLDSSQHHPSKENHDKFVRKFEQNNHLKIEKIFSEKINENEFIYYYNFGNLDLKSKLKFILERRHDLIPNKKVFKMLPPMEILYPTYISTKDKVEIKK